MPTPAVHFLLDTKVNAATGDKCLGFYIEIFSFKLEFYKITAMKNIMRIENGVF